MNAELIAVMLGGAVKYGVSCSGNKENKLSRVELAGLMKGMSDIEMDLAMAKYGNDDVAKLKVYKHVYRVVLDRAIKNGWSCKIGGIFETLVSLAVSEVMGDNLCIKCNGTGLKSVVRPCPCCKGTGYHALSGRKMANQLGIDEKAWRSNWKDRYSEILAYVISLDVVAFHH